MPIYTPGKLTLRKTWQPMDADAAAYITAVETADGQALEEKTKIAIDNFVLGCKADGIWNAIKASCILAGARTLSGALVPLVGTAPTNFNFVSGDYNRKTGLVGNGSTKYLNSNRAGNADPQNSFHQAIYASTAATSASGMYPVYIGTSGSPDRAIYRDQNNGALTATFNTTNSPSALNTAGATIGFLAHRRSASNSGTFRSGSADQSITTTSMATNSDSIGIFAATGNNLSITYANARLAFYSIGESLNLALLDARITDLINAFGVAIP